MFSEALMAQITVRDHALIGQSTELTYVRERSGAAIVSITGPTGMRS